MNTKKNSLKKVFTLVELIIVIAIIAILAVTAFLLLTKRLSKARDSSRASNLANIEKSLQISLTDKTSLPKPDSYTLIYASGTSNVIGYQGYFGDGAKDAIGNINSAPKDGDDYFTYYLNADLNKYQLAGFLENTTAYNKNVVNAVDYSGRSVTVKGDKLGLLTDVNKSPLQILGLTGLNILSGDRTYIAYYDNSTNLSLSGQNLINMLSIGNKNTAQYDTGLVFYLDMETTISSGNLTLLKNLSSYGNNAICYDSGTAGNCGSIGAKFVDGKKGKAMQFNGLTNYISGNLTTNFTTGLSFYANILKIKDNPGITQGIFLVSNLFMSRYDTSYGCQTSDCHSPRNFWVLTQEIQSGQGNRREPGAFSATSSLTGQWVNVIGTRDGNKIKIFVNGALKGTSTRTGAIIGAPYRYLSIGHYIENIKDSLGVNYGFNGLIDEVRIYNRALSDDEAKALYTATN